MNQYFFSGAKGLQGNGQKGKQDVTVIFEQSLTRIFHKNHPEKLERVVDTRRASKKHPEAYCQYVEDLFQAQRNRRNAFRLRNRSLVKYTLNTEPSPYFSAVRKGAARHWLLTRASRCNNIEKRKTNKQN